MLKLAGQKGYLESGDRRRVGEGTLKHLESKRYSRVEQGRYDIEDKTMRKLERMGTTGTGPTRPFPEKTDYQPKVDFLITICYCFHFYRLKSTIRINPAAFWNQKKLFEHFPGNSMARAQAKSKPKSIP